jgi:hypothetical protein
MLLNRLEATQKRYEATLEQLEATQKREGGAALASKKSARST